MILCTNLQETDHICRSYTQKSNGPKFADPSMADDRPLFKTSMMYTYIHIYMHAYMHTYIYTYGTYIHHSSYVHTCCVRTFVHTYVRTSIGPTTYFRIFNTRPTISGSKVKVAVYF